MIWTEQCEKNAKHDIWDWGIALPFASNRTPNKQTKLLGPNSKSWIQGETRIY